MKYIYKFENYNNIEVKQSGGINCDNPSCDWSDMTISVSEYPQWVNKGCPKCGECVLTQSDFDMTKKFVDAIEFINSIEPTKLAEMTKNLDSDDIIDAYLKLKEMGIHHEDDDPNRWKIGGK